jgi:hypothetical protein
LAGGCWDAFVAAISMGDEKIDGEWRLRVIG